MKFLLAFSITGGGIALWKLGSEVGRFMILFLFGVKFGGLLSW